MVHATLAAQGSGGDGVRDAGTGTGPGVDDVFSQAVSDRVFLHCDAVAGRNHSLGELHVFELFGAGARVLIAR